MVKMRRLRWEHDPSRPESKRIVVELKNGKIYEAWLPNNADMVDVSNFADHLLHLARKQETEPPFH